MKKKWKIILIAFFILPCVVFFGGCSCNKPVETGKENVAYNVNFYTGSEETFNIPIQTVYHGELVIRPPKPVRENYSFAGWYKDLACTIIWKFETDLVVENTTLYAKWTPIQNKDNYFTVIFQTDTAETDIADQSVKAGGLAKKPDNPVKTGYDFVAWYRDEALTIKWKFDSDVIDKNTIIYAKWQKQK